MKYLIAFALCMVTAGARGDMVNLPCAEYAGVAEHLADKWKEYPVVGGITGEGAGLVEVFASEDGATFTIVVHSPEGKACVVASGTDWGEVRQSPAGESL